MNRPLSARDRWRLESLAFVDDATAASTPSTFTAENVLHAGQIAPFLCAALTVVICAGRRWGKSVLACFKAFWMGLAQPGVQCCLIGATQGSISRVFWKTLRWMNRVHKLGAVELKGVEGWSMTLPNGSQVILMPVDSIEAADKVRGLSNVAFLCVDESQRYKAEVLKYLLKDVLKAMLIDQLAQGHHAQVWLMGTPNPLGKVGTFWDYLNRKGVATFAPGIGPANDNADAFTVYENTKLGSRERIEAVVDELLAEEKNEAGEPEDRNGTWYQREIMARWVVDWARRVYYLDDEANAWDILPRLTTFAIIFDIGVRNADAVGLWGWRDGDPTLYLVLEIVKTGQDTLDLEVEIRGLLDEYNKDGRNVVLVAGDGGGLGVKILMTMQKLLKGVPVRPVTKPTVNLQVKAFNARARRGLKCSRKSRLYSEVRNSEWEGGIVNGKILETGHSDIVPMARYAAVELENLLPDAPQAETPEEQHRRERREAAEKAERNRRWAGNHDPDHDPNEFTDDLEADLFEDAA